MSQAVDLHKEGIELITQIRDEVSLKSKQDAEKLERLQKAMDQNDQKYQELTLTIKAQEQQLIEQKAQFVLLERQAARLPAGEKQDQKKQELKEFFSLAAYKGILPQGMEQKYYRTDVNPDGGYLAPPEYYNQIIEKVREISPMRQLSMVVTTGRGEFYVPVSNNNQRAYWVGQAGQSTRSNATFEQKKIPLNKLMGNALITWESMEDSMFNMEAFISSEFVQSMAEEEGRSFVRGDGIVEPFGFLYDATVNVVPSTISGNFTSDDLMRLPYTMKTGYLPGASFLFSREAMAQIRTFKSTSIYLWEAMAPGAPRTINGFEYNLAEDMDVIGANLRPVAFGNWRRGYMIAERPEMRVIRDEYTQASTGQVNFIAQRRVGGNVVVGEAISVLECAV